MLYTFDTIGLLVRRQRIVRWRAAMILSAMGALACAAVAWAAPPNIVEDPVRIGLIYPAAHGRQLEESGQDHLAPYRRGIEEAGGHVVAIFQHRPRAEALAILPALDGLLLPGGGDVCPQAYGESPHEKLGEHDPDLDALEFAALEFAANHALPVLAICRGHQVLNVFYKGSLYQDLPSQYRALPAIAHRVSKDAGERPFHAIDVKKGSLLYAILATERIDVHTSHHQAVKNVAPGFRATAWSDDGIIEAIERVQPPFTMGVQFHPEKMMDEDPRVKALFSRLCQEASQAPSRRGEPAPQQGGYRPEERIR